MSSYERTKIIAFSAIATLAGLLIVIIGTRSSFPELLFHSMVTILIGIIVVLVVYAFLWERTRRYTNMRLYKRKMNRLARGRFEDFQDYVERFASLPEFPKLSQGITGILQGLIKKGSAVQGPLIDNRVKNFNSILREPLASFRQRLNNLCWAKKDINYEFLCSLAKEFENFVTVHKRLYVDFAVIMAREIGNVAEATKRSYADYKDDYNQFVVAYTEFAKRSSKARLRAFNEHLQKAYEL